MAPGFAYERYQGVYQRKLTDADSAVERIADGSAVALSQAASQPPELMRALADRARAGDVDGVRLYYFHAEEPMRRTLLQYELMGRIRPYSFFFQRAERELAARAEKDGIGKVVHYVPSHFSQASRLFAEQVPVDTFLVTVSPMDEHGWFTFGTNNDYTSSVARQARRLIVEVNPRMPRVFGHSSLHISEVDAVVEHEAPLPELSPRPVHPQERQIAERIAELVPEHACLQIGVGGLPNAVCEALKDREGLGVHTEVLTPGLAELISSGAATGSHKSVNRGKAVFTFAMGDEPFYRFMDGNLALESHPVGYVNDPSVIARNDRVVSVNSTVEMDLTGACNSEYLGGHQFTATGGQVDFVRGAYASRGGRSVMAFQSTARGGTVSKLVPRLSGPVTTPRTDVHYVVTEYGAANLKGLASAERAEALIALAHPDFRDELTAAAREQHLL
ncbi:acetyl-CoA hydrolase/transferase family protein [Streptomyces boncukensis]|uniref:Acetyl-CoA hydrolase/transferase family protein n=1 Tax=Streptomyces boncukensis TaxID=2711219 RepID=A0A6G4WSF4_9ACTN|nr:acetyl-CoA hydrolase/transferase family protein [Streptomyces boncukensis]NGO67411.1 acetyl-CoA hydrolase/transferase family protein [Streptomyces boncukensis]